MGENLDRLTSFLINLTVINIFYLDFLINNEKNGIFEGRLISKSILIMVKWYVRHRIGVATGKINCSPWWVMNLNLKKYRKWSNLICRTLYACCRWSDWTGQKLPVLVQIRFLCQNTCCYHVWREIERTRAKTILNVFRGKLIHSMQKLV